MPPAPAKSARDPHYLHGQRALEPLLSPPIEAPRAICWVGDEDRLLVANAAGELYEVDPVFGTRALGAALPDPARLAWSAGRLAVLDREGRVQVRHSPEGGVRWEQETGLVAHLHLAWWREGVVVLGEDEETRRVLVFDDCGRLKSRARVGPRTAMGVDVRGNIVLARSTKAGVTLVPFGHPLPNGTATAHALRIEPTLAVLGVADAGVAVWRSPGVPPITAKLHQVTAAALSAHGDVVAMGTRIGQVALVAVGANVAARKSPERVEGHSGVVSAIEFAPRGRRLASVADRCWVWGF